MCVLCVVLKLDPGERVPTVSVRGRCGNEVLIKWDFDRVRYGQRSRRGAQATFMTQAPLTKASALPVYQKVYRPFTWYLDSIDRSLVGCVH